MSDRMYALERLREKQPEVLKELQEKGKLEEYLNLVDKEANELRKMLPAETLDQQLRANEIVQAQMSELPAEHPDSPYADEIKAMRQAGIID